MADVTSEVVNEYKKFDTELFTCTHWRVQMSYQLYRSPYLNYWTYFWTKSPRSWTFNSDLLTSFDFLSAIQKSIFYLLFFSVDHELSFQSHWLLLILFQPHRSPYFTCLVFILSQGSSIVNFLHILIASL